MTYPGGKSARDAQIAAYRRKYANDPEALEFLDRYADDAPYGEIMRRFINAAQTWDVVKMKEIHAELKRRYPITTKDWESLDI